MNKKKNFFLRFKKADIFDSKSKSNVIE